MLVVSCSVARDYPVNQSRIGDYLSGFQAFDNGANRFVKLDKKSQRLSLFQKEPFRFIRAAKLDPSFKVKDIKSSPDGSYALLVGEDIYAIWREDGQIDYEPAPMVGTAFSVSYNAADHIMVLQGEYDSISVIQLDEKGKVVASKTLGPIVEDDRIISGAIADGSVFVAGTDSGKVLKIDLKFALDRGDWVYEVVGDFETPVKYIATHPSDSGMDLWFVLKDRLSVYDSATAELKDSHDFGEKQTLGFGALKVPHVVLADHGKSDQIQILVPDDKGHIHSMNLPFMPWSLHLTYVDPSEERIFFVQNLRLRKSVSALNFERSTTYDFDILGFRLSDGLLELKLELSDEYEMALGSDHYFRIYGSALGYAEKRSYVRDVLVDKAEMFYFDERLTKSP
jgi:hypothetical protein